MMRSRNKNQYYDLLILLMLIENKLDCPILPNLDIKIDKSKKSKES